MESSPIVIEDNPKTPNPIVSIDLTRSPVSKPKQMVDEDRMAVDTTPFAVKRTVTSTGGTRISTTQMVKEEETEEGMDLCYSKAKKPRVDGSESVGRDSVSTRVLLERCYVKEEFDESEPVIDAEPISVCKSEEMEVKQVDILSSISSNTLHAPLKHEGLGSVKKESDMMDEMNQMDQNPKLVKPVSVCKTEKMDDEEVKKVKTLSGISSNTLHAPLKHEGLGSVKKECETMDQKPKLVKPISSVRPVNTGLSKKGQGVVEDRKVSLEGIETGDFEEEVDWLLVGRTAVTGLSTTKGRKLEDNEIVHFAFPNGDVKIKSGYWNSRAVNAASGIVRFSTKRSGEIGRLPMEWSKCLIPLVNSKKVKVLGRCVAAPANLSMMQEIMLYISFYIHHSIFTEDGNCSWKLDSPSNIDTTIYPLLTLFKLLKKSPFQKAEFTPEELDSRKRSLTLENDLNEAASVLATAKSRKGGQPLLIEPNKDAQVLTKSSLNKLVGAADMYNLEEMDPPATLTCDLRPYQKQAPIG